MLFISLIRTTFVLKDSIKYSSFLRYLQFAKIFDFGPLNSHLRNIWPQLLLDEIKSFEISLTFSMTYYKILKVKHTSLKKNFWYSCDFRIRRQAVFYFLFKNWPEIYYRSRVMCAMWQRSLKKFGTSKKNSKCVKFGTKSSHFENFFKGTNIMHFFPKCVDLVPKLTHFKKFLKVRNF